MQFRHELKYLINEGDAALIRQRLDAALQPDAHALNGRYHIRSLYFDDYYDTAYLDKLGGFGDRRKYRIRIYNLSDQVIRLECKIKRDSYICKLSAPLTREELDGIWAGRCGFLLERPEPVCRQFYYEHTARVLRPRVYVDYEREPYVLEAGDVRVTFDRDVRAAYPGRPMFDGDLFFTHALEPGKLVMEVKYTEFLPKLVQQILPPRAAERSAVSKYTLCCDRVNHLTAKNFQTV